MTGLWDSIVGRDLAVPVVLHLPGTGGFRSFCVQHCPPLSAHASFLQSVAFRPGGTANGPDCGWYSLSLLKVRLEVGVWWPCGELASSSALPPAPAARAGSQAWLTAFSSNYVDISIHTCTVSA